MIGNIFLLMLTGLCAAVGPPQKNGQIQQYRQVARVGQSKKLLCPVEADPPPILQWFKDGGAINDVWTRFKLMKEGSLRIRDVELEDAGHYICKATNGFGSINMNYSLIVVDKDTGLVQENKTLFPTDINEDLSKDPVPPRFFQPQKMKRQHIVRPVSSSVRLKCRATGNPRPNVRWVKDGKITLDDEEVHNPKKPKWTLKLHDLKEENSGDYTCLVYNRLGTINFTYSLEVIEKIKTKPVLLAPHPLNNSLEVGDTASFKCRVKSIVQPHIQWLKRVDNPAVLHNTNTTIEVKGQKFVVLKTGDVWKQPDGTYLNKLTINHVTESDSGMYICLGANSMGYSFRSAFLTVRLPSPDVQRAWSPRDSVHSVDNDIEDPIARIPEDIATSQDSQADSSEGSLPLIIAVPACVIVVVVTIAIFLLHRRRRCNSSNNTSASSAHRTARFNPVPTQEKDSFPPAAVVHTNPHMVQTSNSSRSDKLSKNNHSIDFYSDISSVSRSHHNQHNNMQNGYNDYNNPFR